MGSPIVLRITGIWIVFWIAVVGGLNYILVPMGFDYVDHFYVAIIHFLFFAGAGLYVYKIRSMMDHHNPFWRQFVEMAFVTVVVLIATFVLVNAYPISAEKTSQIMATKVLFPLFRLTTWLTKIADITFQQVFIFALLKQLQTTHLTKNQIVITAGIAFALLHLPLIVMLGLYGLYFIVPSIFAGFIFTYFIMNYNRGVFYSYSLHLGFYVCLGVAQRYLF